MATSNRAGHPQRNRKRNRLIYNEDEETSFGPQNRFTLYIEPTQSNKSIKNSNNNVQNRSSSDQCLVPLPRTNKFNKNVGTTLTNSLKTLLKLPKAHNWVNHEWFYGNIDQVLFLDENEFNICLRDSFPQLKTRYLTRMEWSQIRRLMGKPRRCSLSFFDEERSTLNSKRTKIRYLQQNKVVDLNQYKDLPDNIPQPMVVGTQVVALARIYDSLYFGVVEGIEPANGTYRISFNRSDIGSLSIPDFEVASVDQPSMAPLSSFQIKTRKVWHLSNRFVENASTPTENVNKVSKVTTTAEKVIPCKITNDNGNGQNIGGFPIKFLTLLVKISRILTIKRKKVEELRQMNTDIEHMTTHSELITYSFKKSYALAILELDKINKDISCYLKRMQGFSLQVTSEGKLKSLKSEVVNQKYHTESKSLIDRLQSKFKVTDRANALITNLMSLMFQLRGFRDNEVSSNEFQSLSDTINKIRSQINRSNVETFQNNVEIHVRHIMSSVSHLGNVGAFSESTNYMNLHQNGMNSNEVKVENC